MAVAKVATKSYTPATGTGGVSSAIDISAATDPAWIVAIATQVACTVSAVSWSLGSGTAAQVAAVIANVVDGWGFVWKIPAPVLGSGTLTVTLSASVPYQISADLFSGCDQSDPSPSADAFTTVPVDDSAAITLTPSNVAAADAMAGMTSHVLVGDMNGWTVGTLSYQGNTSAVNLLTGYRLAVGSMTAAAPTAGGGHELGIGVRVKAAPPGAPAVIGWIGAAG